MEQQQHSDSLHGLVDATQPGLLGEFWLFLKDNKKWWLLPILLALLLLGALVIASGSGLAPFIYPFV
ncbi:MAG: DUF5989 family protein [Planctomycetaceae bacterium]